MESVIPDVWSVVFSYLDEVDETVWYNTSKRWRELSTIGKIVSRDKIMSRIAARGDVKLFEHFKSEGLVSSPQELSLEASSNKRSEFLKYLKSKKLLNETSALKGAVISDDVLLYLKYERNTFVRDLIVECATNGSLKVMKYLVCNKSCNLRKDIYVQAILYGRMNIVTWIEKKYPDITAPCFEVTDAAADSGSVEMIKHVISTGNVMKRDEYLRTLYFGHLDAFVYLFELSKEKKYINKKTMEYIIKHGYTSCLSYIIGNGLSEVKMNSEYYTIALVSGQVETAKYLRSIGCSIPSDCTYYATKSSNVKMLEYEVSMRSVPDEFTMESAIEKGSKKMVNYLLTLNCPVPVDVAKFCEKRRQLHLLELFS